ALRGVSLQVEQGELVAVAGPSGSGKSTLLGCLAGLDEPDGGTVWIEGRRMSHRPEPVRARLRAERIGYLGQSANLFPHLTVEENLLLVRRLAGRSVGGSIIERLAAVGIADRARAYPGELSGGEVARAGLAVALAADPAVVLADEPTGELDSVTEDGVLEQLAGDPVVSASDRGRYDHDAPFAADDPGPRPEPVSRGHPAAEAASPIPVVRILRTRNPAVTAGTFVTA